MSNEIRTKLSNRWVVCLFVFKRIFVRIMKYWVSQLRAKVDRVGMPPPWMTYEEIELICDVLKAVRPRKCLEWGCGYSTRYFSKFLGHQCAWLSIEHNKTWVDKIMAGISETANVKIVFIPPNRFPWTDGFWDGSYSDLKDYVEYPRNQKFDFILVDGRARVACLQQAYKLCSDFGIVMLHDAQREHYHEALGVYEHQVMLGGYRASHKKIWIGSHRLPVEKIFSLKRYAGLWKGYKTLGRLSIGGKKLFF
ncbi:MAG: hypothetical protein PHN49_08570 [Candidatus Omnitrophica bacterium]|nr:hypothetical protein [Candidatus Omnitrophota bacterium]MDD5671678.1 hypothetical protein [Candidatus Omnitrophota bacterium]